MRAAHGIYRSCCREKLSSSDSIIAWAMKSHTNEHTVRGRQTLKVVKRFRNREGLGEFETVVKTRDEVEGLHNCREFSQPLECLHQVMQTQEKGFLLPL